MPSCQMFYFVFDIFWKYDDFGVIFGSTVCDYLNQGVINYERVS